MAHALARSGDHARALAVLGPLEPLGTDYTALFGACLSVETHVLCGDPTGVLAEAVEQLRPFVDQVATYGTVWSAGSTAYFVGSGLLALGRTEEAAAMLERGVAANCASGCTKGERLARERLKDIHL